MATPLNALDVPPLSGSSVCQALPSQCSLNGHVTCCWSMKVPTAQTSLGPIAATAVKVLDTPPGSAATGDHLLPFQCSVSGQVTFRWSV